MLLDYLIVRFGVLVSLHRSHFFHCLLVSWGHQVDINVAYLLDWNIAARVCLLSHIGSLIHILGCSNSSLPINQLLCRVQRLFSTIRRLYIIVGLHNII